MTSSNQPYQGYPYVNVSFIDAPSIDRATAAQWDSLPVRPARTGGVRSPLEDDRRLRNANNAQNQPPLKKNIDDNPVVYIDIPSNDSSEFSEPQTPAQEDRGQTTVKPDVVIQDTIYYNPYVDRTSSNDASRNDSRVHAPGSSGPGMSSTSSSGPSRREPPNTLNLNSPGSSSSNEATPSFSPQPSASPFPNYMSKEVQIYSPSYSRPQPDGLQFDPIPVTEFPAPPPAYSEVDLSRVVVETPPPPTQVIINTTAGSQPPQPTVIPVNPDRKLLVCNHCGTRVYTCVVKQNGAMTHAIGITLLLLCFLPFLYLVYCMDCCKYKNHYCPNCNQLIGYEVCCQNTVYAK